MYPKDNIFYLYYKNNYPNKSNFNRIEINSYLHN